MSQGADFCGDRLRLSAFLRIVGNGMPQRPSRFRRRLQDVHHSLESSTHHDTDRTDENATPAQETAIEESSNDVSIFDIARSSSPEQPMLTPENPLPETAANNKQQRDRERLEDVQLSNNLQQAGKRTSVAAIAKSPKKPRQISSPRKRRKLPVNELALLRTTSSDGLPQPSETDYVLAAPLATIDPIEDSQMLSFALPKGSVRHVQKPLLARGANPDSAAWILPGRFAQHHSAEFNGARSKKLPGSSFAIGSDGFVGVELNIQHTTRPIKPRVSNKKRVKKSAPDCGGLVLVCGHLPAPPVEHNDGVLTVAEPPMHTGDSAPVRSPTRADERQPLSQRAIAETRKALTERKARKRRHSSIRQHASLVHDQLSNITAPIRRVSEASSDDSDQEDMSSRGSNRGNDDKNQHDAHWLPHTLSSGWIDNSIEDMGYFESAMLNLVAAE